MSHRCPKCDGTGKDRKLTAQKAEQDAEFRHRVKHHGTYVRCWNCLDNGLDPAEYFRWNN